MMRRAFLASALIPLTACLDKIAASDSTIRGTYTLRTVNGAALPFTRTANGSKVELLDDQYSLYSGSTFAQEGHVRTTTGAQVTTKATTETGVYSSQGISVALMGNALGTRLSKITNANTMTIIEDGATYVYKK
ncbi:MAG: hypothetical protein ABJB74_00195 [Gemmatimonas sp.]